MGFLGMSGHTWKNVGKWALRAAPIIAAPFTGGASLLALGAGAGALSGAMDGGGWKGAALGGGLGLIPGAGGVGGAAGGVAKAGLKQGLTQVGKSLGTRAALDVGTKLGGKYAGGAVGSALAGGVGSALTGGGFGGFAKGAAQGAKSSVPQTALDVGSNVFSRSLGGGKQGGGMVSGNNFMPSGGTGFGGGGSSPAGGGGGMNFDWNKWGPLITQGGAAVAGGIMANKAQKSALQRSPEELAALQGAQGSAGALGRGGESLLSESRPYIKGPANYYQALLKGNRAAMTQAVAPGMAQVTGVYRGAERDLDRTGVRGAQRDVASSELGREKASKLAGLVTGVQPAAADALSKLGTDVLSQANPMLSNAGNIYGNLLTGGLQNRQQAAVRGEKAGEAWGGLVRDIGEAVPKGKKKTAPTYATPPPYTLGLPPGQVGPAGHPGLPGGQPNPTPPALLAGRQTVPNWNTGAWG